LYTPQSFDKQVGDPTDSDSDSSFSGSCGSNDDSFILRPFQTVFDQIQLLYHLGILLRRPNAGRRYLKSGTTPSFGSSNHSIVVLPEDISHVRENIRRWQDDQSRSAVLLEEEKEVSWEDIVRRNEESPETEGLDMALIERLALANARRRGQLLYWRDHPDQVISTYQVPINTTKTRVTEAAAPGKRLLDGKSVKSTSTSLFSKNSMEMSDILGPANSKTGSPSLAPRTTYCETIIGGSHSTRVPDAPEESTQSVTFECPYCHLELDSVAMRDRMTWK
jgi:hypothetical protein